MIGAAMNDVDDDEILALVREFVGRQQLAREVLAKYRPWLLGLASDLRTKEFISATSRGTWGDWSYWLHGGGCRLVHSQTGERIEWDAPDLQSFDKNWFANWLDWRKPIERASLFAALERLAKSNALREEPESPPAAPYRYALCDR
jgi:hypothetical protein